MIAAVLTRSLPRDWIITMGNAQPASDRESSSPSGKDAQQSSGQHAQLPPAGDPNSPFGVSLRQYLHAQITQSGLTPAEIARRAKIAPAILYRFINGQRDLSLETIDKILPVIEGEIGSKMEAMAMRFHLMVAEKQEVNRMLNTLRGIENSIVEAIGGGMSAVSVLAMMRMATGNDLDENTKNILLRLWDSDMMEKAENIRRDCASLIESQTR